MTDYFDIILDSYEGSARYLWKIISAPLSNGRISGFYFLIIISILIWGLEVLFPWRKNQNKIRKDFWLDSFYMFFNFYLFDVIIFAVVVKLTYTFFLKGIIAIGYNKGVLFNLSDLNWLVQMIIFFVLVDLVQWVVHKFLHTVPFFWKFHKVHHSVKEMGFAAHLRYHFAESMVYKPAKYVTMSLLFGFAFENIFYIYFLSTLIGHLNHANLGWDYGPLKYLLNNPKMHIWHHAKVLPDSHPKGMNFAISLSCWDYLFGTSYIPKDGRDIELGFPGDEKYPESFIGQVLEPFKSED